VDGLFAAALDGVRVMPALVKQARCAGLLGAMVRDLQPLNYRPSDPRYQDVLDAVLGIFDTEKAATIDFEVRLEAAEGLGQSGDPRLNEDNWVRIESGEFWMGAQREDPSQPGYDPKAADLEGPVRLVNLGAYRIGRYPVTVFEYRKFIEADGYHEKRWWSAGSRRKTEPQDWEAQVLHPNRPVVGVSWYEASAYCFWAGVRLATKRNGKWRREGETEGGTHGAATYRILRGAISEISWGM
jgi:formylglycine-generating enzyme required for sulfatase activity